MESIYNRNVSQLERLVQQQGWPAHEAVTLLNCTWFSEQVAFQHLDEWDGFHTIHTPERLEPRLKHLFDTCRNRATSAFRIVEAIFPLSGVCVVDLLILLKQDGGQARAVQSVVRYG